MSSAARPEDLDAICASLPETELGTSWGDRPTWKVPRGDKGKGFVLHRAPDPAITDPVSGAPCDDVAVIFVGGRAERDALLADPALPFFSIHHFRNRDAVLVRLSDLGGMTRDELREVITEAWLHRAPARLKREFTDG